MSTQAFIEDDDLALYALGLLSPDEEATFEARLSEEAESRLRLAKMQAALGVFAEATVEMQEPPTSSLSRLMTQIGDQDAPKPALRPAVDIVSAGRQKPLAWRILPWTGWALAAGLACAIALAIYPRQADLKNQVAALKSQVQSQAEQRAADLGDAANRAIAKANTASTQTGILAATASQTAQERDALASRLQAQTQRTAEVASDAADAQLILNALKDPYALSVSLKVPKQKRTPSGRGTYVANSGTLIFVGNDLPRLADDKVYELWLMPSNGSSPIAAGTFVPDAGGHARLVVPRFRQGVSANGFAVTAERAGGSSTPTLPILLAGS